MRLTEGDAGDVRATLVNMGIESGGDRGLELQNCPTIDKDKTMRIITMWFAEWSIYGFPHLAQNTSNAENEFLMMNIVNGKNCTYQDFVPLPVIRSSTMFSGER